MCLALIINPLIINQHSLPTSVTPTVILLVSRDRRLGHHRYHLTVLLNQNKNAFLCHYHYMLFATEHLYNINDPATSLLDTMSCKIMVSLCWRTGLSSGAECRFLGYRVAVSNEYRFSEGFLAAEFPRCTGHVILCYDANLNFRMMWAACNSVFEDVLSSFQSKYMKKEHWMGNYGRKKWTPCQWNVSWQELNSSCLFQPFNNLILVWPAYTLAPSSEWDFSLCHHVKPFCFVLLQSGFTW